MAMTRTWSGRRRPGFSAIEILVVRLLAAVAIPALITFFNRLQAAGVQLPWAQ
jgi:hypothetical protein